MFSLMPRFSRFPLKENEEQDGHNLVPAKNNEALMGLKYDVNMSKGHWILRWYTVIKQSKNKK